MQASDDSFFNNRDEFQSTQEHIAKLIDQLDKGNRLDDAVEVSFLITGMETMLDKFSENQYELQHEIQDILESSRQGLLTHEKLSDMISTEQVRSRFLTGIVGSLKLQIETLFHVLTSKEITSSEEGDQPSIVEKVQESVSLLWKSVDSLSKIIVSPARKLDNTIRKIDSEVIVHLNKTMHLSAGSGDKGEFVEKLEKHAKKGRNNNSNNDSVVTQSVKQGVSRHHGDENDDDEIPVRTTQSLTSNSERQAPHSIVEEKNTTSTATAATTTGSDDGSTQAKMKKLKSVGSGLNLKSLPQDQHVKTRGTPNEHGSPIPTHTHISGGDTHPNAIPTTSVADSVYQEIGAVPAGNGDQGGTVDLEGASIPEGEEEEEEDYDEVSKGKKLKKKKKAAKGKGRSGAGSAGNRRKSFDKEKNTPPVSAGGGGYDSNREGIADYDEASVGGTRAKSGLRNSIASTSSHMSAGGMSKSGLPPSGRVGNNTADYYENRDSGAGTPFIRSDDEDRLINASRDSSKVASRNERVRNRSNLSSGKQEKAGEDDDQSVVSMLSGDESYQALQDNKIDGEEGANRKDDSSHHSRDSKGSRRRAQLQSANGDGKGVEMVYNDELETDSEVSKQMRSMKHFAQKNIQPAVVTAGTDESGALYLSSVLEDNADPNSMPDQPSQRGISASKKSQGGKRYGLHGRSETALKRPLSGNEHEEEAKSSPSSKRRPRSSEKPHGKKAFDDDGLYDNHSRERRHRSHSPPSRESPPRTSSREARHRHEGNSVSTHNTHDSVLRKIGHKFGLSENDPRTAQVRDAIDNIITNLFVESDALKDPKAMGMIRIALPTDLFPKLPKKDQGTYTAEDVIESTDFKNDALVPFLKGTSSPSKTQIVHKGHGWELPIYDNQDDILVTRTYKLSPEMTTFEEVLKRSEDPLKLLYDHFTPYLNKLQAERLFHACLPINLLDKNGRLHKWLQLTPLLLQNMHTLYEDSAALLPLIEAIENVSKNLIQVIKNLQKIEVRNGVNQGLQRVELDSHDAEVIQSSVLDLARLSGDCEAQLVSNNIRLLEYRCFFDRVARSASELAVLRKDSEEVAKTYDYFLKTQGHILEIQERLIAVKDRCKRYQVDDYLPSTVTTVGMFSQHKGGLSAEPSMDGFHLAPSPIYHVDSMQHMASFENANRVAPNLEFHRVQKGGRKNFSPLPVHATTDDYVQLIAELQQALEETELEVEELEIELMDIVKARDKTPSSILFFALMHDPSYVPNLQQLVLQFQHLKHFLNYTVHMDYFTLRKRLQVCLVLMPSIEKLVEKYGLMYQSWSHVRLNWFAERKLRGGSADAAAYCPLCYTNLEPKDSLPHQHTHSKKETVVESPKKVLKQSQAKIERQQVKNERKTLIKRASATISLPTLPYLTGQMNVSGQNTPLSGRYSSSNSVNSAYLIKK